MLLRVNDLRTQFDTHDGVVKAVDGVSFTLDKGEVLGIVGESGCGKSVMSLSIMQLIQRPKGKIAGGEILFTMSNGELVDIAELDPNGDQIRRIRGNEISMIFQEPMTSLNPVYTVGEQIMEVVRLHQNLDKEAARAKAVEMLRLVGIPSPEQRVNEYPHQLSGGMRQRVMIAMALSCNPSLLIADEPTTALDVTIEAQILELMQNLQEQLNMAIMFITHDLKVVGEMADRVLVMYTGKVVEEASVDDIFYNTKHPYTKGLLSSMPMIGRNKRLASIPGVVPNLLNLPKGCAFAPRCPQVMDQCHLSEPPVCSIATGHRVKCWHYA